MSGGGRGREGGMAALAGTGHEEKKVWFIIIINYNYYTPLQQQIIIINHYFIICYCRVCIEMDYLLCDDE